MQFYSKIPRLIRWIISVMISFLVVMSVLRLLFYFQFNPPKKAFSGGTFLMGLRFDLKSICILALSIFLLCSIPWINPFKKMYAKRIWNILLTVVFAILIIFYAADHYYYDYLHQRLNANILSYTEDAGISATMAWQSYPIISFLIGFIVLVFVAAIFFRKRLAKYVQEDAAVVKRAWLYKLVFFLLLGLGIFGKIGQFPLRWSDAFTLSDDFKANLALNPFESFVSTLKFSDLQIDVKKVRRHYPFMSAYMGVQQPDSNKLNYKRYYSFNDSLVNKPNVVLVICESFSMYKSSMSGNPLNTTPYFNQLCKNGIFFDRCFTPAYGTARGVWATITGLPDVLGSSKQTASRNPAAVDQRVIINDFKGYDKFYFLGGDPTWANIQGLLKNNIEGLRIYSQDDFKAKKIDVWGISDKNLFLEANKTLAEKKMPFFAIIQTADNHRPYTIPSEDQAVFKKVSFPKDSIKKYGFESEEEMNAFRYTDFSYQQFIEAAKKEKYFDNTIFIFVGDHGINGNADNIYPKSWTNQRLTGEHVPLLFYAPKLIQPKWVNSICSQIDIFPTIATMLRIPYTNNALGRNIIDTVAATNKCAFVMDHDLKTIGVVTDQYCFQTNLQSGKQIFVSVLNNEPIQPSAETDSMKNYLSELTSAYYETAKYLILNNKKN
ncbi:LTA synthase family protein [Ferruginibacter lapsinanis]|uniref:LTA synthase family protein n=1 Tax=Ferruginibacter lapsinanis TaxID=563172 RepID=UPI001E40A3E3|nr:LTA synthase family protein [Ferruginibacter lapsinanis]UEG50031.1 LTA synthase family protein [Ferruginibacter lapsinanis]